jgi:hypothetical protein
MNRRKFLAQSILVAASLTVFVFLIEWLQPFHATFAFSVASILFFFLISLALYYFGAKAAVSKDKNAFTRLIMGMTFGKLFLTLLLVIIYHHTVRPENINFLFPFFTVYIVFTIFETSFLTKLGKIQAR